MYCFPPQKYFQSGAPGQGRTELTVEWTNQHACGGNEDTDPHKVNCNLVLQYMCQPNVDSPTGKEETGNNLIKYI